MSSENDPSRRPPPSSLYALSDDEDADFSTITHSESGRGVKLLYSKSKVYVHPTPSSKDNIPGYMALLQQKKPHNDRPSSSSHDSHSIASSDLLLAWLPESALGDSASVYVKVDLSQGDSPPKQSYLVPPPPTITTHNGSVGGYSFAVPVSAIFSLLIRPPSVGWWYGSVIINSRAGDSFPALFFHDNECQSTIQQKKKLARDTFDPFGEGGQMFWGGDEVLRWLKRYIQVERSGAEPNMYMIEPSKEDKQGFGGKPTADKSAKTQKNKKNSKDAQMDPFVKFVKETGWNIMERFSRVTTMTRRAAQDLAENPNVPPQVKRLLRNPEVQTLQSEFDSARIYLARWAMSIAEQSERDRKRLIWTAKDVMELEDTDVGEFELLESTNSLSLEQRRKPVTQQEWDKFFDPTTGRMTYTVDEVKERVFHGGLDPDATVRKEAWLFLLGVYDWHGTAEERKAQVASLREEYFRLKHAWWERLEGHGGEGEVGEWWREQRGRIEKDVHRTDRNVSIFQGEDIPHPDPDSPFAEVGTNVHLEQMKDMLLTYNEYNKDLGYVQGMSDLLAPLYAIVQDDAMAFWAFQKFMDRMERNFLRDQSGMRTQLLTLDQLVHFMDPKLWDHLQKAESTNFFFFFRMILVWYKREFAWLDILRLWETLWTDYHSANFHLFIALAILEKHRDIIMMHLQHFDEVLKYINELSGKIELESTLIRAEVLFKRFERLVEAVDKKQNFPAPKKPSSVNDSKTEEAVGSNGPAAEGPSQTEGATTPSQRGPGQGQGTATGAGTSKDQSKGKGIEGDAKVITAELRLLLSRKVEPLPRTEVAQKGEGMPSG